MKQNNMIRWKRQRFLRRAKTQSKEKYFVSKGTPCKLYDINDPEKALKNYTTRVDLSFLKNETFTEKEYPGWKVFKRDKYVIMFDEENILFSNEIWEMF